MSATSPDQDREQLQDPDADFDNLPNNAEEAAEPQPERQRGPATYDVYRQQDDYTWRQIGSSVGAPNRREAVIAAVNDEVGDPTADGAFGQFLVVRSNEAKVLTREKKVIPETIADDWS